MLTDAIMSLSPVETAIETRIIATLTARKIEHAIFKYSISPRGGIFTFYSIRFTDPLVVDLEKAFTSLLDQLAVDVEEIGADNTVRSIVFDQRLTVQR